MKIKKVLVSQPKPADFEKSPYGELARKHGLQIDFFKFIKIDGVPARELRQERLNLGDYSAVILTSRNAVDHYFRVAKEMRFEVPETMKYFCISDSTAYYLQKYVQFRKRKIFYGHHSFQDLMDVIRKHKDEKFLLPCSDIHKDTMVDLLEENNINFQKVTMYRTVAADIGNLKIEDYDLVVFFSPAGIKSLQQNFPKFKQGDVLFGAFGQSTCDAVVEAGFELHIPAPTKNSPSMTMAIEEFIANELKKNGKKK